jgi:hypothetical protein
MWSRLGILFAVIGAVVLALSASSASATQNMYPVGQTDDGSTIIRRNLSNNETHVMMRLTGLVRHTHITWQLHQGAECYTKGASVIVAQAAVPIAVSRIGSVLSASSHPGTITVGVQPSWVSMRLFDADPVTGAPLAMFSCEHILSVPYTGSVHWW